MNNAIAVDINKLLTMRPHYRVLNIILTITQSRRSHFRNIYSWSGEQTFVKKFNQLHEKLIKKILKTYWQMRDYMVLYKYRRGQNPIN
jgi:hypothetical protein